MTRFLHKHASILSGTSPLQYGQKAAKNNKSLQNKRENPQIYCQRLLCELRTSDMLVGIKTLPWFFINRI